MSQIDNPVVVTILRYLVNDLSPFFSDPPSCLMIYRILPEISKNLILRAINSIKNGEIEAGEVKSHDIFINTEQNISTYCAGLKQLGILLNNDITSIKLQFNKVFINTMKKILSEGIKNDNCIAFHRKTKGYETALERGISKFYKFINEKIFEQTIKNKNDKINNFLSKMNFLHLEGDKYVLGPKSTSLFLQTTEDMIKSLFQIYLFYCYEKSNQTEIKIKFVKFLFYLTTLEPGAYFTQFHPKYYDESFADHIDFMDQTGFLIIKEDKLKKQRRICCTPLIQCLFENNNISKKYSLLRYGDENAERFLFVETNMKFYAYMSYLKKSSKNKDNSSLNLSLNITDTYNSISTIKEEREEKFQDQKTLFNINLLTNIFSIEIILPNMLIGYITRENLRKLFKDIKSEYILQFLSDHMSLKSNDVTEVKGKKYLINESVVNQILILEKEKNSIFAKQVICYYDFYTPKQYELYIKKMEEKQINYIYSDEKKEIIVIENNFDNRNGMRIIENEVSK